MKRSPVFDPAAGDILLFKSWKVEVISVSEGIVRYLKRKDSAREVKSQPLQEWMGWAKDAKVKQRGLTPGECAGSLGRCVSGPCSGCGDYVLQDAHVFDLKVYHEECCPSTSHGLKKERKTAHA